MDVFKRWAVLECGCIDCRDFLSEFYLNKGRTAFEHGFRNGLCAAGQFNCQEVRVAFDSKAIGQGEWQGHELNAGATVESKFSKRSDGGRNDKCLEHRTA